MMSTPSSASAFATRTFSAWVMLQPGDCSPSRSVVSKMRTRSADVAAADASNGVRAICYRSWTRSRPMIILRISLVPAPIS